MSDRSDHEPPPLRVAWFLRSTDANVASIRYRCYHMAAGLSALGVQSEYFAKPQPLISQMRRFDAVVIVKRIDAAILEVTAAAYERNTPVFLDFCDDVLASEYRTELRDLNRMVFRGVAPYLAGVVTTGASMSERLRGYRVEMPEIIEIPDVAESFETLVSTLEFATQKKPALKPPAARARPDFTARSQDAPARIVWFGAHGAAHSNFGFLSLLAIAQELRSASQLVPFSLEVVSNHKVKYDRFIRTIGVPTRYTEWSHQAAYAALARADVALLTSGDDAFSDVKSANRALQALSVGVPVVSHVSRSLEPLRACIGALETPGALLAYLQSPDVAAADVARAQDVIKERYSVDAVARQWRTLIERASRRSAGDGGAARGEASPVRMLFVIDSFEDFCVLQEPARIASAQGLTVMAVVSTHAPKMARGLSQLLETLAVTPTMITLQDIDRGGARHLRDADVVVLGGESSRPGHAFAHRLARLAREAGVATVSVQNTPWVEGLTQVTQDPLLTTFTADRIATWGAISRLPDEVLADVRERCVCVGLTAPGRAGDVAPPPDPTRAVVVFEDLRRKIYTDADRAWFLDNLVDTATARASVTFAVVTHDGGDWVMDALGGRCPPNVIMHESGELGAALHGGRGLMASCPIALVRGAAHGLACAVIAHSEDARFQPLRVLNHQRRWTAFIDELDGDKQVKLSAAFLRRIARGVDGAPAVVELALSVADRRGGSRPQPSQLVEA